MDQIEQDFARFKQPAMAIVGGVAAALVIATLPHVYLENIVGATGLAEIIPAAAPPLGNTARGLIAVVAGMISASAIYLIFHQKTKTHEGGSDMSLAIRKNLTPESADVDRTGKSRFAFPKMSLSVKSLTSFLKKPKKSPGQVTELSDLPDIKPADRHPDAPARQPIFASSDLGAPLAEKIKRFDELAEEREITAPDEPAGQPTLVPEPFNPDREQQSQSQTLPQQARTEPVLQRNEEVIPRADLSTLSLAQLADRLEAGLERLEALYTRDGVARPPASPAAAPVRDQVVTLPQGSETPAAVTIPPLRSIDSVEIDTQGSRQADMDAALKAALGTLERMTVHR